MQPVNKDVQDLIDEVSKAEAPQAATPYVIDVTTEDALEENIERNRKQLENDALAQDILLKRQTLKLLFIFLAIETGLIFLYAFFQATKTPLGFQLEEWSFKLLIAATISQVTFMVRLTVKHLFPDKLSNESAPPQPTI